MKELTIEQKIRAYDKAVKEASIAYKDEDKHLKATLERIFPELKESEDERIRKELTEFLRKASGGFLDSTIQCKTFGKWYTWIKKKGQAFTKKDVDDAYLKGVTDAKNEIEKQYEANYQIRKDIATFLFNYKGDIKDRAKWMNYLGIKVSFAKNQSEQKPIDKVGPQFKDGYWITNGDYTWKVISVDKFDYTLQNQWGEYIEDTIDYVNKAFHLWTIQDAKEGDVLFHSDSASSGIFIFKEILQRGTIQKIICYCDYDSEDGFCLGENHTCCWADSKILHPATKEQRDLLFQKMKEAGCEWDAEKKELIKEKVR